MGISMVKLTIPFTLPGLNEYINAERTSRYKAAELKHRCETSVSLAIKQQLRRPLKEPVYMEYRWIERDKRRDKDNICAYGRKIIQDTLVKSKLLKNDGWANIAGFSDNFAVDKTRPRIEVTIYETGGIDDG